MPAAIPLRFIAAGALGRYVYSNKKECFVNDISKEVLGLENVLGLPRGFYNNLLSEDDWSFVIKLSALFEAASGQALAAKLKHSDIKEAL